MAFSFSSSSSLRASLMAKIWPLINCHSSIGSLVGCPFSLAFALLFFLLLVFCYKMLVHVRLIPFGCVLMLLFTIVSSLFECPLIEELGLYFMSCTPYGTWLGPLLLGLRVFHSCDYFMLWFMHEGYGCIWIWIPRGTILFWLFVFLYVIVVLWLFHPIGKALMRLNSVRLSSLYAFVYYLLFYVW